MEISLIRSNATDDACEVYLSMKFTGEMYGGKKKDAQAVYLDRVIVVRK